MTSRTLTISEAEAIQTALNAHGDKLVVDGHFGELSRLALIRFQHSVGITPENGNPDQPTLNALGIPDLFTPPPKPKGNNMGTWFTTFVGTTAFKYLVAMVATFIATKLGLDKGSVEGILTQFIGVAMGIWGMWESSRQKIVMNGEKVAVKDLSAQQKATVAAIVEDKK